MTEAFSVFSFKGGSGKTTVSMNLAAYLVSKGKRVAIIDMDLSAPSLQTYAPNREEKTINDYLLHGADPAEVFFDATYIFGDVPGKFYMALADPSGEAISKINQRDTDSLLDDLFLMMTLVKNTLPDDPFNMDYILIDSSPGISTHAINGVAITDHVLMILRLINADVDGTRQFLSTLYNSVQPKVSLIINQMAKYLLNEEGIMMINELVNGGIIDRVSGADAQLAGILPMDDAVIGNEFNYIMRKLQSDDVGERPIHYLDKNSRDFASKFDELMKNIVGEV
ncbi:MAG: ParA family protein [Candidatus Heimdallarchaeota archaeon]|nr:ParA family protein [Candidatus Heimdallarchaeota archaeon]